MLFTVILEHSKMKSITVSNFPHSTCHEVMEPDAMTLAFWMLSFKPAFSLSFFTCIKRYFSSSSLSAVRVVSSVYLGLLIFLPAILIPACDSSSPASRLMYSAYKLNKQVKWGFPGGLVVKNLPASFGNVGLIPGLGRSPGEWNGNPLQYSCLKNPMERETCRSTVHRVTRESYKT